jgi:hypothetical protein
MSVVVEIKNPSNLEKAKDLLGAKTDSETLELALARVIDDFEAKEKPEETEEDFDIDVHLLNRIPPKRTYEIEAEFVFEGRGEPMKYDLSDYNFDEYETEEK